MTSVPARPARVWAVLVAVLMTAGLLVVSTPASSRAASGDLYAAVNASRTAAGLPGLARNAGLDAVAQAWSRKLSYTGVLSHNPSYSSQIPSGWTVAGENVGYAYSDAILHRMWMDSPGHRKNILDSRYNSVGIGWVKDPDGRIWGTQVFARYANAATVSPRTPTVADHTSDGRADVVARSRVGDLYVYPGTGRGTLGSAVKAGNGWSSMTALMSVRDANGDNRADVYARDTAGRLWLYPGTGRAGFGSRVLVGNGWGAMSLVVAAGDANRDGRADLYARDGAGKLWLYPGNGSGGFGSRILSGTGWGSMVELVSTGDVTGDGAADLYARDRSGRLWIYRASGKGGFSASSQIGAGWASMRELVGPGDLDGDGVGDLLATDSAGRMLFYGGNGTGGFRGAVVMGSGWATFTSVS